MPLHQIKPSHPGFNQGSIYCGSKKLGKSDIGRWIDAELAIPRRRRVLSMLGLEGREYIECGRNCDRQIHLSQMCSRLRRRYLVFNFPPKSKIRLFEFQIGNLNKLSTFASILNKPKNETAKFQALHENFYKEKATSLQALQDIISKYEDEKEKLFMSILGKKEKSIMSEQEKACNDKITQLEGSLKKKNVEIKKLADEKKVEADIKIYRNEITTFQEDKKALERIKKSKETALIEAERILQSTLEKALIIEEVQNQNFDLKRQIEIFQEENKILEKTLRQKIIEVEKPSHTIQELEEVILANGANANVVRDYRRQLTELQEEKRILEREISRVKVSANRVANVVANEWKDENDKVMPVRQWLEERRIVQVYLILRFQPFLILSQVILDWCSLMRRDYVMLLNLTLIHLFDEV
ncbi:hypothetical protein P8452_56551 [Trifolium repens]|nr:hypothetical protein P8452_56551 [Trifolium repens]